MKIVINTVTISRACNITCEQDRMDAVPFVSPRGKGCLGSCACARPSGSYSFWGNILKLPFAKVSFESAGHHVAPISLFLLGLSLLL
jgi:hypothetical protein